MHRHTHTHTNAGMAKLIIIIKHKKSTEMHADPRSIKLHGNLSPALLNLHQALMRMKNTGKFFSCVHVFVSMCAKVPLGAIRLSHNMAKPRSLRNRAVSTRFQHSQTEKRKEKRRSDRDAGNDGDKKRVAHRQRNRNKNTELLRKRQWKQRKGNQVET